MRVTINIEYQNSVDSATGWPNCDRTHSYESSQFSTPWGLLSAKVELKLNSPRCP